VIVITGSAAQVASDPATLANTTLRNERRFMALREGYFSSSVYFCTGRMDLAMGGSGLRVIGIDTRAGRLFPNELLLGL
jgi:hypothetical protein